MSVIPDAARLAIHARPRGFTLLEVAFVMAVLAVIMTLAVPSYSSFIQRQQLREVANTLLTDLRHAREMSVNKNSPVFVSFQAGPDWCWGISSDHACDCGPTVAGSSKSFDPATGRATACTVTHSKARDYPDVKMDSAADAQFVAGRGQATQHGITAFSTLKGQSIRVELNAMGRAQICGPAAQRAEPC